mgnify:CR=1 FL=1|jgi:hypothetical protein
MKALHFTSAVHKAAGKGGWTYVTWPSSTTVFGTKGTVKVRGRFDNELFQSSFMAMGGGVHMLPVTGAVLKKLGKQVGDTIEVTITERLK